MCYRLLVLAVLLAACAAGWNGPFVSPSSSSSPPAPTLPLPANVPDAAATQTLDRAIVAMAPERLGCVETKLWQRVTLPNLTCEAKGRYLMASQGRFRLELHTKQDSVAATRLTLSDGTTLWQANRVGESRPAAQDESRPAAQDDKEWVNVTKLNLAVAMTTLEGDRKGTVPRSEWLQGNLFGGVATLLSNLRGRMNWVKIENVDHEGKPRLRLTGVWRPAFVAYMKSQGTWPPALPEQCRVDLDPITLWPYRLEWWGPITVGAADTLLAQIEFRDPIIYTTLSPEQAAKEFTFHPGKTLVVDQTDAVKAEYAARRK